MNVKAMTIPGNRIIAAAWLLFIVSLILPSYEIPRGTIAHGRHLGYYCAIWVQYMWPSNILLLFLPLLARFRSRASLGIVFGCMCASVVAAISMTYLFDGTGLIGFYVWVGAFVCASAGLFQRLRARN